jgi:AraC family transcriptional regulator
MSTTTNTPNTSGLQPRLEDGRPMRIAGLRGHYTREQIDQIPEQWKRLIAMGEIPGRVGRLEWAFVVMGPNGADYLSGFEVESDANLPAQFVTVEVPAYRCAIFPHEGHVSRMRFTFNAIFNEWLPASGYTVAPGPNGIPFCLERYGEKFDPQTKSGDIEIWVPVLDRNERATPIYFQETNR